MKKDKKKGNFGKNNDEEIWYERAIFVYDQITLTLLSLI